MGAYTSDWMQGLPGVSRRREHLQNTDHTMRIGSDSCLAEVSVQLIFVMNGNFLVESCSLFPWFEAVNTKRRTDPICCAVFFDGFILSESL